MICVYKIENKVNGKKYIGKTLDFKMRKVRHISDLKHNRHRNKKLQNSFNKHGIEKFEIVPIVECSEDEINDLEKYYVWLYNSTKLGYNITNGGEDAPIRGKHFYYNGDWHYNVSEYARKNNMKIPTLSNRINRGHLCNDTVKRGHVKECEWNGVKYNSVVEAAKANNMSSSGLVYKINKGYKCDSDKKRNNKSITINTKRFESLTSAAKHFGIKETTFKRWLFNGILETKLKELGKF